MLFEDLIQEYEAGPWAALKYSDRPSARARRLLCHVGSNMTVEGVQGFLDGKWTSGLENLQRTWKLKNSSMNRYLATLDSMGFKVKYLPVPRSAKRAGLSAQDLAELDARVRGHPDADCQAIYAILRDTGCRGPVELDRVTLDDMDWIEGEVTLRSYKGSEEQRARRVPLSDVAHQAFRWWFNSPPVSTHRWRLFWADVRLNDDNVPYDLRHTFCTRLLECDVPVPTVMQIMGHSTMEQTLYYQHQRPSALQAARSAIQNE